MGVSVKLETTWHNLKQIPWDSVFKCAEEYKRLNPSHNNDYYLEYLRDTWGIEYAYRSNDTIRIVDEQKYTLFLLKWA